jgi:hypothetical protein
MTSTTDTVPDTDHRHCGCCGQARPANRVAELGVTPGVFICAGCALWAARRAGPLSALPRLRRWLWLPQVGRRRDAHMFRTSIPILPSTDLDRTTAFYAQVGFAEAERHDNYLLLHSGDVELHFAHHDDAAPCRCFLFVADAAKLHQQLHRLDVGGVGPLTDQDYGLREFILTDPDRNEVRIGSPLH